MTPNDLEQIGLGVWRRYRPREAWRQVYGLMRICKVLSNVQRFNLAESARGISPMVCQMAYWATILVNRKYGMRAM